VLGFDTIKPDDKNATRIIRFYANTNAKVMQTAHISRSQQCCKLAQ